MTCCNRKIILKCIEILTDPTWTSSFKNDSFEEQLKKRISAVLQEVIKHEEIYENIQTFYPSLLEISKSCDISVILVEWCLVLLILLNDILSYNKEEIQESFSQNETSDLLSISQQKMVLMLIQFIVVWGINPGLLPGVGISLHKRTRFGTILQEEKCVLSPRQKHRRLVACVIVLLHCISKSSLGNIILSTNLTDLLSALLQLCYAPIKRIQCNTKTEISTDLSLSIKSPDDITNVSTVKIFNLKEAVIQCLQKLTDNSKQTEEQLIKEMWKDRNILIDKLELLLNRVYKPLLIQTLFLLQRSCLSKKKMSKKKTFPVPKWLIRACGTLLSKELIRPLGVFSVIHGLLDSIDDDDDDDLSNLKRYELIGRLIAQQPSCCTSSDTYYQIVCPQILKMFYEKGMEQNQKVYTVLLFIISHMSEIQPILTTKYIFEPLLKPLMICLNIPEKQIDVNTDVLVNEEELNSCIEILNKIMTIWDRTSVLYTQICVVFTPLFHLFCFTINGVFHLRQQVENTLIILLKSSDNFIHLIDAALFDDDRPKEVLTRNTDFAFRYGEGGCIKIVKRLSSDDKDWCQEINQKCLCVLKLLNKINDKKITGQIFFFLMEKLQEIEENQIEENNFKHTLREIETKNIFNLKQMEKNLLLLQLVQKIIENFENDIIEDTNQAIIFIQRTLARCSSLKRKENSSLLLETISMAVSSLATLISQKDKLLLENWSELTKCIPSLQELIKTYCNTDMESIIQELIVIIATHGSVSGNKISDYITLKKNLEVPTNYLGTSKVHEITINKFQSHSDWTDQNYDNSKLTNISEMLPETNTDNYENISTYQRAMQEIKDSLLPIRGHALITLRRLIEKRDPETMENTDKLLKICIECISDNDSYIYLSSIHCLVALGIIKSDEVIYLLAKEFSKIDQNKDLKIKLAEALMHISRQLGELAPKYRDILLPAFLNGTKNRDLDIRASSLSNLGEICQRLKYSVGTYIQEIITCIRSLIKSDPSIEVRRAAILTLSLLLRGLGTTSFKVLDGELTDIYRLLKSLYSIEKDNVMQLHIQTAIEEINIIIRENFQITTQDLVKEIRVLHPF